MKVQDIFCLVVRLSGYFLLLFAVGTVLGLIIGPADLGFRTFLTMAVYGGLGAVIIRMAPVIGAFAYPDDPAA